MRPETFLQELRMQTKVVIMMIPVYQRVTPDKYRLIVAQADTIPELAEQLGCTVANLYRIFNRIRRTNRKTLAAGSYQITFIEVDE